MGKRDECVRHLKINNFVERKIKGEWLPINNDW